MLCQKFLNCKQAQKKVNHCSKKIKKRQKNWSSKNKSCSWNFDFCAYQILVRKKHAFMWQCLVEQTGTDLDHIQLKMSKNVFLPKSSRCHWFKSAWNILESSPTLNTVYYWQSQKQPTCTLVCMSWYPCSDTFTSIDMKQKPVAFKACLFGQCLLFLFLLSLLKLYFCQKWLKSPWRRVAMFL